MVLSKPKQVIIVRKDLGMSIGKAVSQGAHASLAAVTCQALVRVENGKRYIMFPCDDAMEEWLMDGQFTKVVLEVNSIEELRALYEKAVAARLLTSYIVDEGLTEFNGVHTPTTIAIGPHLPELIDPLTGSLPLYK